MRIDSAPTLERVAYWRGLGCTMAEIAAAAGLPLATLHSVWYLRQASVDEWTADRVRAARVRSDRIAVTRKLQALAVMGWSCQALTRYGSSKTALNRARTSPPRMLSGSLRAAVDAAWRECWDTPGPSREAAGRARAQGWAPPAAWDDLADPAETPQGVGVAHATHRQRVSELRDLGCTDAEIRDLLGLDVDYFRRIA